MKGFSKVDIENIFGIKRTRLQEWMDRGFIEPSIRKADGKGSKALFSLNNLYQINLFVRLVTLGLSRSLAASCLGIKFKFVEPGKNEYGYYLFKQTDAYPILDYVGLKLSDEPPNIEMGNEDVFNLVISLLTIKGEVDRLIMWAD